MGFARLVGSASVVICVGMTTSCSDISTDPEEPSTISASVNADALPTSVTIDGIFDHSEWMNPVAGPEISLPDGTTTNGRLYFRNDFEKVYVGLALNSKVPSDASVRLCVGFYADESPPYSEGDDAICVRDDGLTFDDLVFTAESRFADDVLEGGTRDGEGVGVSNDGTTVLEMSHPLDSGDAGYDIAVQVGDHLAATYYVYVDYPGLGRSSTVFSIYHYVSCIRSQGFRGYGSAEPEC
jgi:hypothetical protein